MPAPARFAKIALEGSATIGHCRVAGLPRSIAASVAAITLLAGCGEGPTESGASDPDAAVEAASAPVQFAASARELRTPPAVVIRNGAGAPLRLRRVGFTVTSGTGAVTEVTAVSDTAGRAVLPRFVLADAGRYRVDARIGVARAIRFSILALPASLLETETAARCPLADDVLPHFRGLPRTAARLKGGQTLTIVAFGSSSTFGTGASDTSLSFPSQMQRELQRVFRASTIRLINAGIPGHNSVDLDRRLDRDVLAKNPDLVILQTGTNDALQSIPADTVRAATARTISRLKAQGIEVILLDSQRYRGDGESARYRGYVQLVTDVAQEHGVSTARRYGWMSAVLAAGRYTYTDLLTGDGLHQSDLASECTAHLLSAGITAATFAGDP